MMNTNPKPDTPHQIICANYDDVGEYVNALIALDRWEPLVTDPKEFVPWLEELIKYGNSDLCCFLLKTSAPLLEAMLLNRKALAGRPITTDNFYYHPDYLDALIEVGVDWLTPPAADEHLRIDCWAIEHHRDLGFLLRNPTTRKAMLRTLDFWEMSKYWDAYLTNEHMRSLISIKLDEFKVLRDNAPGSFFTWQQLEHDCVRISAEPRLRTINASAVDAIVAFDPAAELAERLRRGTIVEYTWPVFEREAATFDGDGEVTVAFPYVSMREGSRLKILDGTTVRTFEVCPMEELFNAYPIGGEILLVYMNTDSLRYEWKWLSEDQVYPSPLWGMSANSLSYPTQATDSLYIGATQFPQVGQPVSLQGSLLGFGPFYTTTDCGETIRVAPGCETMSAAVFHQRFAAGSLPGLEIPEAARIAAAHNVAPDFTFSFTATTCAESPFGAEQNRTYGLVLRTDTVGDVFVSPLSVFHATTLSCFSAIKKPADDVWYLGDDYDESGHVLFDAATETPISPARTHTGSYHCLKYLPQPGFHHLRVRNEKVSAKMRACTTEQARALIDNPLSILDFAEGDETLAAAIAGILAEIRQLSHVNIKLPPLSSVPKFLTYLYE